MSDTCYSNSDFLGLAGKADARFRGMPIAGAAQKVSFTATATANASNLPLDAHVMLTCTQACFIRPSVDGTSAATVDIDMYLVANLPYLIRLGQNRKISVVRASADGVLYIVPMQAE